MSDTSTVRPSPQGTFMGLNSSQWKTIATWIVLGPLGAYYKMLAAKWGLPIPDADGAINFLVSWGPPALSLGISVLRRTQAAIVAETAKILAARAAPQTAAVVAQAAADIKASGTTSSVVRLLPLLLLLGAASPLLGACSASDQPLTAKSVLPTIANALVKSCAYYNANQVPVIVLTAAVEQAIKASASVQGTTSTVENLVTLTCALLAPRPG